MAASEQAENNNNNSLDAEAEELQRQRNTDTCRYPGNKETETLVGRPIGLVYMHARIDERMR